MSVSQCWSLADWKGAPLTECGSPFEDPSPAGAESDSLVLNGEEKSIEPKLLSRLSSLLGHLGMSRSGQWEKKDEKEQVTEEVCPKR